MKIGSITRELRPRHSFCKRFSLSIFVFALLLRLGLIFVLKTYASPYHFSEYTHIADRILEGNGYSHDWYGLGAAGEGSFMPPVYVAVVLVAKTLFPTMPWLAIQIFQALLSACTVTMIYLIGREIFTELVGGLSSCLVAVYPPVLGYVLDIQTLTVETFLVTSVVLVCIYWQKNGTWRLAAVLGFTLGIAVLSRSNLTLVLPLLCVWMIVSRGRRGAIHFVVVAGVFALTIGPWVVRNYLVHQEFVLVSTKGGFVMFQGNSPSATGTSQPLEDMWKLYPDLARELAPLGEAARDKRLYQESITFIQTHPQKTLVLALRKFVYFWWFGPGYIEKGITSGYPWYYGVIYMGSYAGLFIFSILGFALSHKKYRKHLFVFYALFLVQTLVSMLFIAGVRFRGILEPLLAIFAAYGIIQGFTRIKAFRLHRNEG